MCGMNTATNNEQLMPTIVTFDDVPEYRDRNWQAEYDAYMVQIRRDEYAFGPFSEAAQ